MRAFLRLKDKKREKVLTIIKSWCTINYNLKINISKGCDEDGLKQYRFRELAAGASQYGALSAH